MVAAKAGCKYGVACTNGTLGLHLAMHALGIGKGDQVLVPNITFAATANAVCYTGASPIFVDIDPRTWQMDLGLVHRLSHTQALDAIKAIVPVHVLGNVGDLSGWLNWARENDLVVIEDAAESLGSYYRDQHTGSFGRAGVFSFNGNKIITTGGGGVIVTDDEELARRMKHLSTQAKVNPETYDHDEIGFNYRLVNILAAVGVAQMELLDQFVEKKKYIDGYYRQHLQGVGDIRFQEVPPEVNPNCWLFTFRTSKQEAVLKALKEHQIIARPFWRPMNQLPMFKNNVYLTEEDYSRVIHEECLSIPSSVGISEEELEKVVKVVKGVF